jgi:hypothetical protein
LDQGKKALLVGVNRYHDSKLTSLRYSVNDVSAFYDLLTDSERGGFSSENCLLLTDKRSGSEPSRSNLMSALKSLCSTATSKDFIFFFFSGHGIEEDDKSYLLPSDARINVLRDTAVPIDWIRSTLSASKAHAKVLIFDACHASAMKGKAESGRMTKGLSKALLSPMEGFAILSSCKMHEVSYEMPDKKHGVFSYFLIEGLQGKADYDSDYQISVSDASRYTAEKTLEWSFGQRVEQTPNLEYHVVGDLVLVNVPRPGDRMKKIPSEITSKKPPRGLPLDSIRVNFPRLKDRDEADAKLGSLAPAYCKYLLRYFDLDQVEYDAHGPEYKFPLGSLDRFGLSLNYDPSNLSTIDDLFLKAGKLFGASTVVLISSKPFNKTRVAKMVKARSLNVSHYDPAKHTLQSQEPFLKVLLCLPGTDQKLAMDFLVLSSGGNKAVQAVVVVYAVAKEEDLNARSIQSVKPTNLIDFMGDIWES